MNVADIMTTCPITITGPEDDLDTAVTLMSAEGTRHALVVDNHGLLRGVVSLDQLKLAAMPLHTKLAELCSRDRAAIRADAELAEAARALLQSEAGCLPVVRDEAVVGILTARDFVRHAAEWAPVKRRERRRRLDAVAIP